MSRRNAKAPAKRTVKAEIPTEVRARQALDSAHFRDAIDLYKLLLKQENRAEWREDLALAYAGRAKELMDKKMFKEALVIWRNRAEICGKPLFDTDYLRCLQQTSGLNEAIKHYAQADLSGLSGEALAEIDTCLAAAALCADEAALSLLNGEHPLRRHRATALAAFDSYSRGDFAAMDEQLRAIPFRSPYRDLRPILKALALLAASPPNLRQAQETIQRLAPHSPFDKLVEIVRIAALADGEWLKASGELDSDSQKMLLDIKGCPPERMPALRDLAAIKDPKDAAPQIKALLRHAHVLPTSTAQWCLELMAFAPPLLKDYEAKFGKITEFDRLRLYAINHELQDEIDDANRYWEKLVRQLTSASRQHPNPNAERQAIQAALILRRMAQHEEKMDDEDRDDAQLFKWLESSLELDIDDRPTYVKLIQRYRQANNLKQARHWLELALARFPEAPEILLEAVETALASDAFKKAVAQAKRLLELDPINTRVRSLISHALLSHARKKIRAKNFPGAIKELDEAEEWLISATDRAQAKLLHGLCDLLDGLPSTRLSQAMAALGGGLMGEFYLLLELAHINRAPKEVLGLAKIKLAPTATPQEVIRLAQALPSMKESGKRLGTAFDSLRAKLVSAAKGDFSATELIEICESFSKVDAVEIQIKFAEAGMKRWPDRPIFVLYYATAKEKKQKFLPMEDSDAIDRAMVLAGEQGDRPTELRLKELSRRHGNPFGAFNPFGDDFDDDDTCDCPDCRRRRGEIPDAESNVDDMFEQPDGMLDGEAIGMLRAMIAIAGPQAVISLCETLVPADIMKAMKSQAKGNKKMLAEILIDAMEELAKRLPPRPSPKSRK
ncbi:MAG TPA: hypothetical protein VJ001_08225 [Rhodocyclaceae bacterium]|nr:hypothetical protein [Rhodocyclaceae bacterium]